MAFVKVPPHARAAAAARGHRFAAYPRCSADLEVNVGAIIAGVLAIAVAFAGPSPADPVAELTQLEDVWNQAHVEGDAGTLDQLMTDDVVVIVPKMPAFSKVEALSVFRSGRMKFAQYSTSDIRVRQYGGFAVVTGNLKRTRAMGERVLNDEWRFTKVYVPTSTGWRVVSFHASDAGE
jgi:ketosteroid isomerase-like protein